MSDRSDDPEMLRHFGRVCPIHADLVSVLTRMNKKLNFLILAAVVCATLVLGKDVLAGIIAKVGG